MLMAASAMVDSTGVLRAAEPDGAEREYDCTMTDGQPSRNGVCVWCRWFGVRFADGGHRPHWGHAGTWEGHLHPVFVAPGGPPEDFPT